MGAGKPLPKVRRCGFVAVLGWTNVGKSTLLNRLLAQKMAITSPRPQTTRHATSLILTTEEGQAVFIDTPGFHRPRHLLNRKMLNEAARALGESDVALRVISPDIREEEDAVRPMLEGFKGPRILAANKMDLLGKAELAEYLSRNAGEGFYREVVPVSAATGENVSRLAGIILGCLPEGPPLYPEEDLSDRNERFFMGEIIREKVILHTRQELPYATAVIVEDSKWSEEKGLWRISATIYVEKDSQKGIVIGAGGRNLKIIGQGAREELEVFLQGKVFLELWVKVRRNWTCDPKFLEEIGYDSRRG